MKKYVCGLLFSEDGMEVALIQKTDKHDLKWQSGLLNGIGGKMKEVETAQEAQAREFEEEAGVKTNPMHWSPFLHMTGTNPGGEEFDVWFFRMFNTELLGQIKTMTDEKVERHTISMLFGNHQLGYVKMIENLTWIIPLALDESPMQTTVRYNLK